MCLLWITEMLNNFKKDIFSRSKMSMIPFFFHTYMPLNSYDSLKCKFVTSKKTTQLKKNYKMTEL